MLSDVKNINMAQSNSYGGNIGNIINPISGGSGGTFSYLPGMAALGYDWL